MGWLCSPHEISLDGPLQTLARRRSLQRLQEQHPEVIQEVFRLLRNQLLTYPAWYSCPPWRFAALAWWSDWNSTRPRCKNCGSKLQDVRICLTLKQRWLTYVYLSKIMQYCCYMYQDVFRKWGTQKNVGAASICQGAQGLCTASGEGRMLNSDSVESLKGQERSMQDRASKKSIEIYKTHHDGFKTESLHSLVVFEFIYLDGWSFIFFDPGLFGTWTHPATNRVRLGWICATDFFQPQQLKAKTNLGKAEQDAAKRKGLKYDSTKPEGKLEKETYSREWARCTQGNWRT